MKPGRVISSADVVADKELLASEYYQDFLRYRDVFYLLGSVISDHSTSNALLALTRPKASGPWSAAEKDAMQLLTPHLERAVRLNGCFASMRQERDELLDRLPLGIIILAESGRIDFLNRAARLILDRRDGLYWCGNAVSAVDPSQSSHLQSIIAGAKSTASGKGTAGGGSLSITRSSNGRPYSVLVAPLRPTATSRISQRPRVMIFVGDPETATTTNLERLAAMFSLTPAESRLAGHLVQGKSLAEAAGLLGITQETARVHLKRIFGKTYTGKTE